jgi:hypothetical protein
MANMFQPGLIVLVLCCAAPASAQIPATSITTLDPKVVSAVMARRSLAERVVVCARTPNCRAASVDLQALCGGEPPEGPGWVDDVEHIPGTNPPVVAPPPLQQIEQGIEFADYPICKAWCDAHRKACNIPEKK